MQAIQSIESAAPAVLRWPSPFRALIWKEWRQQRSVFLSLAGLAYAVLILSLFVANDRSAGIPLPTALQGFAGLVGIAGILILSANAFSGERDDNTDLFLETIPCSRGKLFGVKLGFVLFLFLSGLLPVGAAALIYIGTVPHASLETNGLGSAALAIAATVIVLATIPALVASFGGSVIATFLASVPAIGACVGYVFVLPALIQFLPIRSNLERDALWVLLPLLMLATLLLAARRMWVRVERTWRGSLRTTAATSGLLIAYVAVPAATVYLYVTFFAPLSFFFGHAAGIAARESGVSPDGKYVAFETGYSGWGRSGARVALVDTDSGRTRWLTRFRSGLPVRGCWSPSGDQFALYEFDTWLWPFAREARQCNYFVVDAQSGEKRSFDDLCPGLIQPHSEAPWAVGWYSNRVFAFRTAQDILFADIESHQVRRCKTPAAFVGRFFNAWPVMTRRGMFFAPDPVSAKGELRVLQYAPDLPEAEFLSLRGITDKEVIGLQTKITPSDDGKWALVNPYDNARRPNFVWYLAQLTDGAKATSFPTLSVNPTLWPAGGFLPGSHQILVSGMAELGLFDADSHDLRRIPLEETKKYLFIQWAELSPEGGFALVGLEQAPGVPYDRNERVGPGYDVVDLKLAASVRIYIPLYDPRPQWLGEDRLMFQNYADKKIMPWVMDRDGSGARPLLAN